MEGNWAEVTKSINTGGSEAALKNEIGLKNGVSRF